MEEILEKPKKSEIDKAVVEQRLHSTQELLDLVQADNWKLVGKNKELEKNERN